MADDLRDTGDFSEVALDLDEQSPDLEAAMRDAVAAVEGVEGGARPGAEAGEGGDEVARLRREIADLRDRSMRTLADFDNFRKRSERERQELRRYALLEPMREHLKRGVEMIHRQMQELMRRFGVTEIAATGQPFDPTQHEAVSREESPEVKAPTVVAELRRGYRMHDRLLRPAMVKVAVPPEAPASPAAGDGEGPAL